MRRVIGETPVQVLAKRKTRRGWFWTFNADELVAYGTPLEFGAQYLDCA
jgi:hypothetical protein